MGTIWSSARRQDIGADDSPVIEQLPAFITCRELESFLNTEIQCEDPDPGDKVMRAFGQYVENLKTGLAHVKELNLTYRCLGNKDLQVLSKALQSGKLSSLSAVMLRQENIYDVNHGEVDGLDGVLALAQSIRSGAVRNLAHVTIKIFINHNSGTNEQSSRADEPGPAVVAIVECFQSGSLSNLRTLDLCYCIFGCRAFLTSTEAFQLGHFNCLRSLYLSNNKLKDADIVVLAGHIQGGYLSGLEDIRLSHNDFGEVGAVAFGKSLLAGQVCNLQTLDLIEKISFGNAGLGALAACFESGQLSNLRDLYLPWETKTTDGVEQVAKSFREGRLFNLQTLKLSFDSPFNQESGSVVVIARTLEEGHLPSLTSLILFSSKISSATEQALVSAYKKNKSLVLNVNCGTRLSTVTSKSIEKFKQRNRALMASWRVLEGEPNVPGAHSKVFMCGNPGVGKTTLRATMVEKKLLSMSSVSKLVKKKSGRQIERTRGIEVSYIESKKSDEQPLSLAVWDLAGQSDYHVLHSAFLPDLALGDGQATFFVVVCSTNYTKRGSCSSGSRVTSAENQVVYWLRYISSNSEKGGHKGSRRKVFVVLNCFHGDKSGHDPDEWSNFLADCRKKFAAFLTIYPQPFILNAKEAKEVELLKRELQRQAKEILRNKLMPKICFHVQQVSREWAENSKNSDYPVLDWERYRLTLFPKISEEKLIAATEYLQEAGHLIRFKKEALMEGGLPHVTLVILDPEFFCQKLVGHLLLPNSMAGGGETPLRQKMAPYGSLPWKTFQGKLVIPADKVEEVLDILLSLGLCYRAPSQTDKIFVPALIERDDTPKWPSLSWRQTEEKSWVMGSSLVLKDSSTTLLPMALLRKLQVALAQDPAIGKRPDCDYKSGQSQITFTSQGMDVFIEFSSNPTNSQQDRLDILVKSLTDDSDEFHNVSTREQQVNLATCGQSRNDL